MSTRFDQNPNADYGKCNTCGINIKTESDANDHMSETFDEAKAQGGSSGHSVRTLNPTRAHRLEREVSSRVDDAISEAMRDLDRLVDRGDATEGEITKALGWHSDFQDAWHNYINEDDR